MWISKLSAMLNHINIAKDLDFRNSQKVQNNLVYFPLADDEKVKSDSIWFSLLAGH